MSLFDTLVMRALTDIINNSQYKSHSVIEEISHSEICRSCNTDE